MKTVQFSIRLSEDVFDYLRDLAIVSRRPTANLVAAILEEFAVSGREAPGAFPPFVRKIKRVAV